MFWWHDINDHCSRRGQEGRGCNSFNEAQDYEEDGIGNEQVDQREYRLDEESQDHDLFASPAVGEPAGGVLENEVGYEVC